MRKLDKIAKFYKPEKDFDNCLIERGFDVAKDYFGHGNFLELGCATGQSTIRLLCYVDRLDVVEGSTVNIRKTQDKIKFLARTKRWLKKKEVNFFCCDWRGFSFPRRKYSDVIWFHGLEHVLSPTAILSSARESLIPGGRLHVIVPNADSFHRKLGVALGLLKDVHQLNQRDKKVGHATVYDYEQVSQLLKKNGFKIDHWHGIFFKLFSNKIMMDLTKKIKGLDKALFDLGKDFPANCAELYICATQDNR